MNLSRRNPAITSKESHQNIDRQTQKAYKLNRKTFPGTGLTKLYNNGSIFSIKLQENIKVHEANQL